MLPIVVKTYKLEDGRRIRVVRDDLLPGGTKQRALLEWMPKQSSTHFVFGSAPATGYAQVALALVCRELGLSIKLFMAKRKELHPRTVRALAYGADIEFLDFGMLSNTEAHAKRYAADTGAYLLPIGLEAPGVLETLAAQAKTLRPAPSEFWSVVGGGTLNRALQLAWPDADANAVMVGHNGDTGRATRYWAPEKYQREAEILPPFDSVKTVDAKAWRFVLEHASDGALLWNVGAEIPPSSFDFKVLPGNTRKSLDANSRFNLNLQRVRNGCLLWTGGVSSIGYGSFWTGTHYILAHQFAFERVNGPVKQRGRRGSVVIHSCDTQLCCEPTHLSESTHAGNVADRIAKGRPGANQYGVYPRKGVDSREPHRIESVLTTRSNSKETVKMATKIQAKYKGFVVTAVPVGDKVKVISFEAPEGTKVPANVSKSLINVEFDSWGRAGRAGTDAVTTTLRLDALPPDRRMVFYRDGESRPVNARDVASTPTPKAKAEKPTKKASSKTVTAVADADDDEEVPTSKVAKNDATAKRDKASKKPGKVTTKAGASAAPKSTKGDKPKSAKGGRAAKVSDDAEDLDI